MTEQANKPVQRLTVHHRTVYNYARAVKLGTHRLMIRPRDSHDLRLINATVSIQPQAQLRWMHDVFGNSVAYADFDVSAQQLSVTAQIVLDRYSVQPQDSALEPYAQFLPFSYPASEIPDLGRTIERHFRDPDRLVTEWVRQFLFADPTKAMGTTAFLLAITGGIRAQFRYGERHEPGVQSPVETLKKGSGSCRDFAILMMEAVRSVGLAARFVSGYLYDPAIDGNSNDTFGAGATHAWVQVYLPGAGWLEFDPTNGAAGGHNLVPVAVAREPSQAVPISGTFDGAAEDFQDMNVQVEVRSVRRQTDAA